MEVLGVTQKEAEIIKHIIEPYLLKYDFYCYGSRVKGDFRPLSDLDIMVKGTDKAEVYDINELKTEFDKSLLPYVVSIVDFYQIDENFYNLIKNDLVKI